MPALLIGGALFIGAILLATRGGGGVVRRTPPGPIPGTGTRPGQGGGQGYARPQPPIQPTRPSITPIRPPSTPGVSPDMTSAIDQAQAVHDAAPAPSPMPSTTSPDGSTTSHYQSSTPGGTVSMTSTPSGGPRRPSPPPSRVTHDQMMQTAHSLATIVHQSHEGHEEEVADLIRRFQSEYGHGLRVDGTWGPRTRHALATALGVDESTLPEHLS